MLPEQAPAAAGYRPDVDGLRAIAVVAVMLFHLEVPGFDGGYVGVDIFFVISGFLITRILVRELEAGGPARIAHFYARRVLRIFPALVAVALACAIAGWFLLLPSELVRLGESLGASAFFAANFYFLGYEGYQNALTQQVPLLHLWSLSVEEQFYLLYPWLLAFAALRGRYAWLLAGLLLLSLLLAFALGQRSANAAFLFGPARAWELLLGGLVALGASRLAAMKPWQAQACGLAGAVLVALAIAGPGRLPVPGRAWLLLPCAGAALLIAAGMRERAWTRALLGMRPLVFVGLISYSLYLWHWPLIVFHRALRPFQPGLELFVIPASFVLAVLSWRFIEQPFRRLQAPDRRVLAAGAFAMAALAMAGALLVQFHDRTQLPPQARYFDAYTDYRDPDGVRENHCFLPPRRIDVTLLDRALCLGSVPGKPTYLLAGDSHAAHLWNGLARALPHVHLQQLTGSACKPLLSATGHATCDLLMQETLGRLDSSRPPDAVILAARWADTDPQAVRDTVQRLLQVTPRVIVLGPAVEYLDALPRLLALAQWRGDETLADRARVPGLVARDAALARALEGSGARYVSLHGLMCPAGGRCATETPVGVPLQFDYGHFTREGAYWIGVKMRPALLP